MLTASGSSGCSALRRWASSQPCAVEGGALLRDEARHERHHHHAAGPAHLLEDVVGHVAGDVGDGAGRGVREQHRRIAHLDRLPHRVGRDVAEVDQHAEPVHLAHHVLAEVGEAAVRMRTRRRIGPGRVVVVGERHVAGAQPRQDAQDRERARDAVAALDADHRRHLARGRDPLDVVGGARRFEPVRVATAQGGQRIDLLERLRHRFGLGQARRHVDRPELPTHPAGGDPRQVGLQGRHGLPQIGLVLTRFAERAQRPQQVVVSVDQGSGSQQLQDVLGHGRILGVGSEPAWPSAARGATAPAVVDIEP